MDTGTMVNGKELYRKINFKYLTLFQLSLCLGTVLAQASDGLLRQPGAANSLQLPWPHVQRTVIATHRQKVSPSGSVGRATPSVSPHRYPEHRELFLSAASDCCRDESHRCGQCPAGQLPIQRTLKRGTLTILPIDTKGYIPLQSAIMTRRAANSVITARFDMTTQGGSCLRTIVRRLPNLSASTELPGAQLHAFCQPKAWLLRLTGLRWKSTRSLATCRGEHEPLLAGEDCGMSTPHGRGRYNFLRV
jgi:hypothetical protein